MSRIQYYIFIIILILIGFFISFQLSIASSTAHRLIANESLYKVENRLAQVFRTLKRFPKADEELKSLVLDAMNFSTYSTHVAVRDFRPGSTLTPASFRIIVDGKAYTSPVILQVLYYGSEYKINPRLIGKLLRG